MLKYSRQRAGIKRVLLERHDHPTAEMVYQDIQKIYPKISLGTVYRNLSLLADMGEIKRISTEAGPDRFDGNIQPHCHFLCRSCGIVMDLNLNVQELLSRQLTESFAGSIDDSQIQFFGICPECRE